MIEFSGEISDKCKNYVLKQNAIVAFWGALIPIIFLNICLVIVYVLIDKFVLWMFILCEMFLLLVLILAFLSPYIYRKKTLANMLPQIIRVNEEGAIVSEFGTFHVYKTLDDIKRIIDFGDWYYVVFKFPKRVNLICQKSLIVEGTINDFERVFCKQIMRK